MKILVVGANGQLGTDCISVLNSFNIVHGVDFPEIDISDNKHVWKCLDTYLPDVIVNCAAYTAVDACEDDTTCWKVNANGPAYLAGWVQQNNAFLIQISTDYVFNGKKSLFSSYTESDTSDPCSEYGRSKLAGEQFLQESEAEIAILRTAWLYGANGTNFLKTMLRLALQNPEREIRVVGDQFGSPTCSHTLAQQISKIIEAKVTGLFHATSEGYCSWYELAHYFLTKMNVPFRMKACTSLEYPTRAHRPKNSILENKVLKDLRLNVFDDWKKELDAFVLLNRAMLLKEMEES